MPQNILSLLGRTETSWFHCNSLFLLLHGCMCTYIWYSTLQRERSCTIKARRHMCHSSIFLFCFLASVYLFVHNKQQRVRMKYKSFLLLPMHTKNYISFSEATKIVRIASFSGLWYWEDNAQNSMPKCSPRQQWCLLDTCTLRKNNWM